jgi:aspartate/methionine/tyrosine aminotransferase
MTVSRLRDIPGIGVDKVGDAADAAADPQFLRLENLDTDLRPPQVALEATHAAIDRDDANSYLPFQGHLVLREAACAHVAAITGRSYDPGTQCVSVAGGLNGILNVLLATVEPGQEVVICDPVYAGLVNRIRLAGGVPRFVSCTPARPRAPGPAPHFGPEVLHPLRQRCGRHDQLRPDAARPPDRRHRYFSGNFRQALAPSCASLQWKRRGHI